ncbi:MAG: sialidase family protein [Planctomycetota bacterium]
MVRVSSFAPYAPSLCLLILPGQIAANAATESDEIKHVVIEAATKETPRSDTASIAQLPDSRLMVVYHKYESGEHSGRDHGICRVWCKTSKDKGITWNNPRMLIDVFKGDMNVQAPALLRRKAGDLMLISLRAHPEGNSSSMCLFRSPDGGESFLPMLPIWKRSNGQLLQGGASSLIELKSGRLLLPFHGGIGNQWRQKNSAWCMLSDDGGKSWKQSEPIDLPKRGAMEGSVAQFDDKSLLMSLRTQLGGPYLSRSVDEGETWSKPEFCDLEGGESGTCLRRLPGTNDVVMFFNNSKYQEKHHHFGERTPLTCARSSDQGKSWQIIGNIAADPQAEYTNLDCFFTTEGNAILTYMYAKPAWNRDRIHLKAAIIPKSWFKVSQ